MRLVGHAKHLGIEYKQTMSGIDDKYLSRIRKLLDTMTERDKLYFQQNKKTKRAASLRKVLDDWAREYRDVLKVSMADAYTNVYHVEKEALALKKVKSVDKQARLILGKKVNDTAQTSAIRYRKYVDSKVKQGFSDGTDVYRQIAGTASLRNTDGAVHMRDMSATSHIDSSVMTGANDGRKLSLLEADVRTLKWISTLDGRTCQQCASLDQKTFKVGGDIFLYPPAHPRCRCLMVEDVEDDIGGQRGALEDEKLKPKYKYKVIDGKRTKIPNPDRIDAYLVPSDTSFKEWFPTTSTDFQKEWLGPSRYKAWKSGDFKIEQFTDSDNGNLFTLEQLKIEQLPRGKAK